MGQMSDTPERAVNPRELQERIMNLHRRGAISDHEDPARAERKRQQIARTGSAAKKWGDVTQGWPWVFW